jgi:hypothetical protein
MPLVETGTSSKVGRGGKDALSPAFNKEACSGEATAKAAAFLMSLRRDTVAAQAATGWVIQNYSP